MQAASAGLQPAEVKMAVTSSWSGWGRYRMALGILLGEQEESPLCSPEERYRASLHPCRGSLAREGTYRLLRRSQVNFQCRRLADQRVLKVEERKPGPLA